MGMEDAFMADLWHRQSEIEHGDRNPEEKSLETYYAIQAAREQKPEFGEMLGELDRRILAYCKSIARFTEGKLREEQGAVARVLDEARHEQHESLIEFLKMVAKRFRSAKLDVLWDKVLLSDRLNVETWALDVGKHLKDRTLGAKSVERAD
jgi:hypothetical protein